MKFMHKDVNDTLIKLYGSQHAERITDGVWGAAEEMSPWNVDQHMWWTEIDIHTTPRDAVNQAWDFAEENINDLTDDEETDLETMDEEALTELVMYTTLGMMLIETDLVWEHDPEDW